MISTKVLLEAQDLGYAEADPSFDVDGIDTAHKLSILASLAYGTHVDFPGVYIEGIRHIGALDIQFAREFGYRIKLLGLARRTARGIEQRVHPCMAPLGSPISEVGGVTNAVVAVGNYAGQSVFEGPGAGAGPTASAVIADIVDIARNQILPPFAAPFKSAGTRARQSDGIASGRLLCASDRAGSAGCNGGHYGDHGGTWRIHRQHHSARTRAGGGGSRSSDYA